MDSKKIDALWGHLHWLTELDRQGSFTAAAKRLGVSKAAMSHRIAELEQAAGVPLVLRTTRSVRLTDAGQRLVDDTRGAFAHIAQTFSEVSDQSGAVRGLVRLTAPVALARQQLVPCLASFLKAYPDVRLELDLSDRVVNLAHEGFDLAIRHSNHPPDTHVAVPLCGSASVLVASPGYAHAHGLPEHPGELSAHSCLHYPRAPETPAWSFEPIRSKGSDGPITVPLRGSLAANNSEALRDAALLDLGIALLPDFSAQAALARGELVRVLPNWRPVGAFADKVFAVRPYAPQVPRAVHALVTHLKAAWAAGFVLP